MLALTLQTHTHTHTHTHTVLSLTGLNCFYAHIADEEPSKGEGEESEAETEVQVTATKVWAFVTRKLASSDQGEASSTDEHEILLVRSIDSLGAGQLFMTMRELNKRMQRSATTPEEVGVYAAACTRFLKPMANFFQLTDLEIMAEQGLC